MLNSATQYLFLNYNRIFCFIINFELFMCNYITWASPENFHAGSNLDSWIRTVNLDKDPLLYEKKDELRHYDSIQIRFKSLGEFWRKRSMITQFIVPIAAIAGLIVSPFLLSIPGIICSLTVL